jgi:alkyl hydroperoxide reductase subunit AhpC
VTPSQTLLYLLQTPQEAANAPVVCPTEILAFNKAIADFQAIGCELLMCSTDSEFTHLAWSQMNRKEGGLGPDLKLTMVRLKLVEL